MTYVLIMKFQRSSRHPHGRRQSLPLHLYTWIWQSGWLYWHWRGVDSWRRIDDIITTIHFTYTYDTYIYIYIYILYNMILFYLFSQHKIYGRFETLVWENWRITPLYYILAVICVELALRFFLGDPSTSEILVNNNQDVAPSLAISVMSQIHNIFNVEPWYYPVGKSS